MKTLLIASTLLFITQTTLADVNSELIKAATDGQTQSLKALIRGGADIQSDGGSALISAAHSALERHGNEESFDSQIEAVQMGAEVATVADEEDIQESLRILLSTRPGERVMQDLFGCDLESVLFEEVDQGLVNTVTVAEISRGLVVLGAYRRSSGEERRLCLDGEVLPPPPVCCGTQPPDPPPACCLRGWDPLAQPSMPALRRPSR